MSEKKPLLEEFKFGIMDKHYFEEIESSFWDSENIMTKKYKAKKEQLKQDNVPEEDIKILENAYKILLNSKSRQRYSKYLLYQYSLIQPLNMNLLIEKYYSIIFPFYLFTLKSDKEDNKYIILDYMNFSVNFYERNALKSSFEVDMIEDIELKRNENSLKIKIIKNKNKIILTPQIEEQLDLIYALMIFMSIIKKKKDIWKKDQSKVNEINQNLVKEKIKTLFDNNKNLSKKINKFKLLILSNDCFIPKGIKYGTFVEDKTSNQTKFLLLGTSYIYLFKDEEMKDILNIIPLIPGYTMFEFNEKEKNIKVSIGYKEYNLFFDEIEAYNTIFKTMMNISETDDEIFDEEDLDKVSESLYNDKIMGGDLKNTPLYIKADKDLVLLELKIETLKRAKIKLQKKELIYDIVNGIEEKEEKDKEEKEKEEKEKEEKEEKEKEEKIKEEKEEKKEVNVDEVININMEIKKQEDKDTHKNEIQENENE